MRGGCSSLNAKPAAHQGAFTLRQASRSSGACTAGRTWRCRRGHQQRAVTTAGLADVAGVLVVSAIPFAAVQALADSDLGKDLQKRLEENKPKFREEQRQYAEAAAAARADSRWYGPERPRWLGPLPFEYPSWLQGEAPGDYSFDIAGLSVEEGKFDKYFELELLHARWAMLGALGALLPEALQYSGVAKFLEPVWWKVGGVKASGEDLNYLGVAGLRIAGSQGIIIIAICQVLLMFGPEYARSCGIDALEPLGVFLPGDENYPGGWAFDPFGLANDAATAQDLKVKEIKNGRLAMIAWAGFFAQGAVTKTGPVQNLLSFLEDPAKNNVFGELQHFQWQQVTDLSV